MQSGVQCFSVAGLLGIPADHPTLGKALERYACSLSNMCISPFEPVYLVKVGRRKHIMVRAVALNGQRAVEKSAEDMRLAAAKVLGLEVQKLKVEWEKYENARRLRVRNP